MFHLSPPGRWHFSITLRSVEDSAFLRIVALISLYVIILLVTLCGRSRRGARCIFHLNTKSSFRKPQLPSRPGLQKHAGVLLWLGKKWTIMDPFCCFWHQKIQELWVSLLLSGLICVKFVNCGLICLQDELFYVFW